MIERYAFSVDWRGEDDATAADLASFLHPQFPLMVELVKEDVKLTYKGKTRLVTSKQIGKERYVVIHAIAALLQDDFAIRLEVESLSADTHTLVIAPISFWKVVDAKVGKRSTEVFRPLRRGDGFNSPGMFSAPRK